MCIIYLIWDTLIWKFAPDRGRNDWGCQKDSVVEIHAIPYYKLRENQYMFYTMYVCIYIYI